MSSNSTNRSRSKGATGKRPRRNWRPVSGLPRGPRNLGYLAGSATQMGRCPGQRPICVALPARYPRFRGPRGSPDTGRQFLRGRFPVAPLDLDLLVEFEDMTIPYFQLEHGFLFLILQDHV